jgi:hypothetical protein
MSDIENLSPQIIRRLVKEMNDLVNDIIDIQADIEGPGNTLSSFLSY